VALAWKKLDNNYILPFLGIAAELYPQTIYLATPWMQNGTIIKYLKDKTLQDVRVDLLVRNDSVDFLPWLSSLQILEVAEGVAFLHSHGLVHGDLKGVCIVTILYHTSQPQSFASPTYSLMPMVTSVSQTLG
jgi:serine/threonine protein kinase